MKFFLLILWFYVFSAFALAQQTERRIDYLTVAEDDLVHEAQELDRRVEIYVKAIDRRFLTLNGVAETKKKDAEKYGALPTGTAAKLLNDVKHILEEAVRNIDNTAERDAKNHLLPIALKALADGCSRFIVQLKPFSTASRAESERAAVYDAMRGCEEVIQTNRELISDSPK